MPQNETMADKKKKKNPYFYLFESPDLKKNI